MIMYQWYRRMNVVNRNIVTHLGLHSAVFGIEHEQWDIIGTLNKSQNNMLCISVHHLKGILKEDRAWILHINNAQTQTGRDGASRLACATAKIWDALIVSVWWISGTVALNTRPSLAKDGWHVSHDKQHGLSCSQTRNAYACIWEECSRYHKIGICVIGKQDRLARDVRRLCKVEKREHESALQRNVMLHAHYDSISQTAVTEMTAITSVVVPWTNVAAWITLVTEEVALK